MLEMLKRDFEDLEGIWRSSPNPRVCMSSCKLLKTEWHVAIREQLLPTFVDTNPRVAKNKNMRVA
jgi:hypothetical protein